VVAVENADAHTPLFTSARYSHVPAELGVSLKVVEVLVISVHEPALTRFCHFTTLPVCPPRVKVPVEVPVHDGVVPPVTLPAMVTASTVICVPTHVVAPQLFSART